MQFSDTTNKNGIIQRIEDTLGYPDGTITGDSTLFAYVTADVNEGYEIVAYNIRSSMDDWDWDDTNHTDLPVAKAALTTDRYIKLETDNPLYRIKRVDVTFDDTNWYEAQPLQQGAVSHGMGNDDKEDDNYVTTSPRYDLIADAIGIWPKATSAQVAAGAKVRIVYVRAFDLFTTADTTQEPGFDRAWHHLLVTYPAMKRAVMRNHENAPNLKVLWDEGIAQLRDDFSSKNQDAQMVLTPRYGLNDFS